MSNLNLFNLIPSKFDDPENLLDDYIRVIQDSLISTQISKITKHAIVTTPIASTDTSITVQTDTTLSTTVGENVLCLLWSGGVPESGTYEFINLEYSNIPYTYTIERAIRGSTASNFAAGSFITKFVTISVEEIIERIDNLLNIINPRNCPNETLQYLGDLIGAELSSIDESNVTRRRNELLETIDWYRLKGSYKSIQLISLVAEFTLTIYELFTNDYNTFIEYEWATYNEDVNPNDLDSTYYKSPHFGLYVMLDRLYSSGTYVDGVLEDHLWRPSLFSFSELTFNLQDYVERTRPINTVPHYALLFTIYGDESGAIYNQLDANSNIVSSSITSEFWEYSQIFFDDTEISGSVDFDESWYFDNNVIDFLATLTTWKIGNEDKDLNSGDTQDILNPVLTGNVSSYWYNDEKIVLNIIIPKETIQWGMTELAIYQETTGTMMIFSTFPDINKSDDLALRINITIYRTNDSERHKEVSYAITAKDIEYAGTQVVYGHGVYGDGLYY